MRTTSVYLMHRVLPMLPEVLSQNVCSLNPGVERLAFSVYFVMNNDGFVAKKIGNKKNKSVISFFLHIDI